MPKEKLQSVVTFRCHEKCWMINDLMVEWLKCVWNKWPGALLKRCGLLVLDSFHGHTTDEIKKLLYEEMKTDITVIPGRITSQLQVMDVGVNKPLKKCCISNCMDGMEDYVIYEEDEATV